MRKEVKLGMFIGGGLVALLVVYLLVAPPSNAKKGVQLAEGAGNTNIADLTAPDDTTAGDTAAASPATSAGDSTATPAAGPNKTATPHTDDSTAPKKTGDTWNTMLQNGTADTAAKPAPQQPLTAKPAGKEAEKMDGGNQAEKARPTDKQISGNKPTAPEAGNFYVNPHAALGDGLSTDYVAGSMLRGTDIAKTTPADIKASAPVAGGTHVVRSGETFSSIAQAAYGSSSYYPALIRANPNVNPNNLKLGTAITLPRLDEVKATGATAAADRTTSPGNASVAQPDVKIDTTKQYKVQSGDSLYKISLKLYGKSTYVDRIYEANKQTIGADPKKLKLGMILELPEKPAATGLASPRDSSTSTLSSGPNFAEDQAK